MKISRLGERTDEIIPKVLEAGAAVVEEVVLLSPDSLGFVVVSSSSSLS